MIEMVLRRIAVTCAVLLLFAWKGDRTRWEWGDGHAVIDGAVYNIVATTCGVVALIALAGALTTRPRLLIPLLGLLATAYVFVLAAVVAGVSVWAQVQGNVWFYGAASQNAGPLGALAGSTFGSARMVYPAQAPYLFTGVAILGATATIGLGVLWFAGQRRERATDLTW